MKNLGLKGKCFLVTGVEGFLGSNLKQALMNENAYVVGNDIRGSEVLDISDEKAVDIYVEKYKSLHAKFDGLINNAALSFKGLNITAEEFEKTMAVNIRGTVNMITKLRPLMNKEASIVNISSIFGSRVPDFSNYDGNEELFSNVSYGATKAGIEQMTRYYAKLYGADVRVNSIAPGGIWQNHSEDFVNKYSRSIAMKRMANVDEIVNAILFLLSPMSSYITGQIIKVDGGFGL